MGTEQQASITDEELAEMLEWIERYDGDIASVVAPVFAALRASRAEVEHVWERYDNAVAVTRRLRTALGRAPETWLKDDEEAWAAYTGDSGIPPPDRLASNAR